jgi:hypothetical protein
MSVSNETGSKAKESIAMRIGTLDITFHRTVRVAKGRTPANLPLSLGHIKVYEVQKFKERCPDTWEDTGVFIGLHDQEAMWMSFHAQAPVALLVGAGSINALTGQKLGTKLDKDNYLVVPPQPWLDGWKNTDGTVSQFCATAYKKGEGLTVAEQLIGAESKTGGIGLALFEPAKPLPTQTHYPPQGWTVGAYASFDSYPVASSGGTSYGLLKSYTAASATGQTVNHAVHVRSARFSEMGLGKGGAIRQHIYPDPYGLEVWRELPSQTRAIYIVAASLLAEITGEPIPEPVTQEKYHGGWFGLKDQELGDVKGSEAFTGLKTVFAEEIEPVEKPK